MNCPSCARENPDTAVRCLHCGVPLIIASEDRTMDTPTPPDDGTLAGGVEVTPSGRTPKTPSPKSGRSRAKTGRTKASIAASKSRSTTSRISRAGILEPGEELGPRFVIEALLGEG